MNSIKTALILLSALIALCGCAKQGEVAFMDGKKLRELIIKNTPLAGKDTNIEIHDETGKAPYKINGIYLFRSAYRFNFDPVPYDNWILDGEKLYKGHEIMDVIKKHNLNPKSKKEAYSIAKYILFADRDAINSPSEIKEMSCSEKNGVYEAKLRVTTFTHGMKMAEYIFTLKIGNGVCEAENEPILPRKK